MSNGSPFPDDLISAFRDGELSAAEREAAARLLEDSADARVELEDYQALSDLLRSVPGDRAPAGFRAAVMGRIERESLLAPAPAAKASRPRLARRSWIIGTALAASAAGLLLVLNLGRDHLPAVGGHTVATNSASDGPVAPPTPASFPRGSADGVRGGVSFGREALEDRDRLWDEAEPVPAIAASEAPPRGFGGGSAGQPPAGAQPGDSYSFAELGADGEVMIVNATVLDLDLGLNQLRYLLAKNSIRPQPVATHDYADLSAVADPAGSEFAVYVVSDPAQINAALNEARRQSDLFLDFKVAGVLNTPTPSPAADAAAGEALEEAAPQPAEAVRREMTRDARSVDELREREPEVAGRARASYPAERFAFDPADRARGGRTDLAVEAPRPAPPSPFPPAPADLASRLAESDDGEPGAAYQQLLNVSKAEISLNLQRERDKLSRQNSLSAGAEGGAEAARFGVVTDQPQVEFFDSLKQAQQPLADSGDKDLLFQQKSGTQQQAQQVQKRLRMLLLLEPDLTALKAKADARSLPVEAPRPASKKS